MARLIASCCGSLGLSRIRVEHSKQALRFGFAYYAESDWRLEGVAEPGGVALDCDTIGTGFSRIATPALHQMPASQINPY